MNLGDLVNFHSDVFSSSNEDYVNPGVVIEIDDSHRQMRYTVMWSDSKITSEFPGYLYPIFPEKNIEKA
tara:strand:- start:116 stop:322 length:207 start_codon:yes stop_codon:yes gene_type:complete